MVRTVPRRSRLRRNGARFTSTRSRPVRVSSASTSVVLADPSASVRTTDARRTARSSPSRTSASPGAPRNDDNVANHPTASRRFVFPSPLPPVTTVRPGAGSRSAAS